MTSSIFSSGQGRRYDPEFFRPRSRKPEKMLGEFIAEARRIVTRTQELGDRHKSEIENADFSPKFDEPEFIYLVFGRMISDGEPIDFSYDFHQLRKEFLDIEERKAAFNPFDIFLRLSKVSGGSPLWQAIWAANSSLRLVYNQPVSAKDEPIFDPFFYYDAMISTSALAFYIEVADRYGEEMLMAILNGVEIEVGYSLPTDRV